MNVSLETLEHPNADPISWVADRLSEFAQDCPDDTRLLSSSRLDRYLQSLYSTVEVGMEDVTAATEHGEDQMMKNVSRIKTEASGVTLELSTCHSQLKALIDRLRAIGADQLNSLSILSGVDALKRRLTSCRIVLSELHQWDVRARELELLLKSLLAEKTTGTPTVQTTSGAGSLGQAVNHLVAMKETASSLENLPQFEGKLRWVQNYESRLLDACRGRVYQIVEMISTNDCVQCAQVCQQAHLLAEVLSVPPGLSISAHHYFRLLL